MNEDFTTVEMPENTAAAGGLIEGLVAENGDVVIVNNGDLTVESKVEANGRAAISTESGDVVVNGAIEADNVNVAAAGNVTFGADGTAFGNAVSVTAGGNILDDRSDVTASANGYVAPVGNAAAITADEITLNAGGDIGGGVYDYVTVDANKIDATAGGNTSVAAASGKELNVGSITAGGTASVYTDTTMKMVSQESSIKGKDVVVSAKDFSGGIASIAPDSSLCVNNFIKGQSPLLAIFNTAKGGNQNPTIDNQPNDTIIFIDGRLAGGDIKVINKLGALEAFPVQTPELKSEQGIFGNPLFLHDDLDVANPLAVGAIDYLLLDLPRLELSSDFPIEVDKQVTANGLNPTTSYWFGQNPATDEEGASGDDNGADKSESTSGNDGASPTAGTNPVTAM